MSYGQNMPDKLVQEIYTAKNFPIRWIRDFADEWVDAADALKESNINRSEYERRRMKDAKRRKVELH